LVKFSIGSQFADWNRLFLKTMKKTKDKQEILLLVAIMEEQWNKLTHRFEENELGLPHHYINLLKSVIMMPNEMLFLQASRTLFSLMKSLGAVKNIYAPIIYKILVTAYSTFSDLAKVNPLIFR
jgi:hypothetical protein